MTACDVVVAVVDVIVNLEFMGCMVVVFIAFVII